MSAGIAAVALSLKTSFAQATPTRTTGSGLRSMSITVARSFAVGACCARAVGAAAKSAPTQAAAAVTFRHDKLGFISAPHSERTRPRIRIGIRVWVRKAATVAIDLRQCLGRGSANFVVPVLQSGSQRIHGFGAPELTKSPDSLFTHLLIAVSQRSNQRINRLLGSDATERPCGLTTDVGVGVLERVREGGDGCRRHCLCLDTCTRDDCEHRQGC